MKRLIFLTISLFLITAQTARAGQMLSKGQYARFHQNENFKLTPPPEFNKMRPIKNGLKLFDDKDQLTITIVALKVENPDSLSDLQLLNKFKKVNIRKEFFNSLNSLSQRKVKNYIFKNLYGKAVFEFVLMDDEDAVKPAKSIIFYENSKEYRITLETKNNSDLEKHSHFIPQILTLIGII